VNFILFLKISFYKPMATGIYGRSPPSSDEQFTRGRFSGKVAIVTGGASGIGEATVRRFVNDGAAVAIFDINEKLGKELETSLKSSGHNVVFCSVDVSDRDQCVKAVDRLSSEFGRVDFLVNGAAYFGAKGEQFKVVKCENKIPLKLEGATGGGERVARPSPSTTLPPQLRLDLSYPSTSAITSPHLSLAFRPTLIFTLPSLSVGVDLRAMSRVAPTNNHANIFSRPLCKS
jgi:hypothetical protein